MIADANTFQSKVSFRRVTEPTSRNLYYRRIPRNWRVLASQAFGVTMLSGMAFFIAMYLIPTGGM